MFRRALDVAVDGGQLVGLASGSGPELLLLHGGPAMAYTYLDALVEELRPGYTVAVYQQRGLSPSVEAGPFTVGQHVADGLAVLDALGWEKAWVLGHSWGGHLGLHLALAAPDRMLGLLAVEPLGGVGDGGEAEFDAEMLARTPPAARARAAELDARALRGEASDDDLVEGLGLFWPAYFADPSAPAPMPQMSMSLAGYAQTMESVRAELPALEAALPRLDLPVGFVLGMGSPMPPSAGGATAMRIAGAWVETIPGAGHFPWLEAPGSVRAGLDRLTTH